MRTYNVMSADIESAKGIMKLSNISSNSQFEEKKGSPQLQNHAKNINLGIAVIERVIFCLTQKWRYSEREAIPCDNAGKIVHHFRAVWSKK